MLRLVEPFIRLMGSAEDSVMLMRLADGVVEPLLPTGAADEERENEEAEEEDDEEGEEEGEEEGDEEEGEEEEDEEEEPLPIGVGELSERLFALASHKSTAEKNRQALFELQRRVESLIPPDATPGEGPRADAPPERGAPSGVSARRPGRGSSGAPKGQVEALKGLIRSRVARKEAEAQAQTLKNKRKLGKEAKLEPVVSSEGTSKEPKNKAKPNPVSKAKGKGKLAAPQGSRAETGARGGGKRARR